MAWAPTTDQILNLDGVRQRTDTFRFELCDRELNPIGDLHPDRLDSSPSIQVDTSNAVTRRLTGMKLIPSEADDVNMLRDRLRVYMTLQNGVEYRLGTFLWADGNRPTRSWGDEQHAELVDFGYILNQPLAGCYGWGQGATITLIIFFLMFRAGFALSNIKTIGAEAQRGLADKLSWQPGVTWMQMLTDLGNMVGFAPPWFTRDGQLIFDQAPDPAFDQPSVPEYESGTRIIADSILHSDNFLSAPNDIGVFDSGTGRLTVGRYELPAAAPHSFAERGFRIGVAQSTQGLESQEQADLAARNLARTSDVFEILTFASTADPRHEVYDIVDALGERWLETAWSLDLRSGGLMQHTMKRVSYDVV